MSVEMLAKIRAQHVSTLLIAIVFTVLSLGTLAANNDIKLKNDTILIASDCVHRSAAKADLGRAWIFRILNSVLLRCPKAILRRPRLELTMRRRSRSDLRIRELSFLTQRLRLLSQAKSSLICKSI